MDAMPIKMTVDLPGQDLIDKAKAMFPVLRERAQKADEDRGIPQKTHEEFMESGLYNAFRPARYGGRELPVRSMVDIGSELGKACGSSAWIWSNLAVQNWITGMHHPEAQEDVWGDNPHSYCGSAFSIKGHTATEVDGGLKLDGVWSFASGSDFTDWTNLQVFIPQEGKPPLHRFVLVPKSDWEVEDDWYVTGLSGTGSRSLIIKDVFVPEHRVLDTQLITGGIQSPGAQVNDYPLYKVPPLSLGTKVFSSPTLGVALGALDFVVEEMMDRKSVSQVDMTTLPTAQVRVAHASAELNAAKALLISDSEEAMAIAETGEEPPVYKRAEWRLNNAMAGQLCVSAVERLGQLIGARGLGQDSPFQRASRDVHAAVSQITMSWDLQTVNAGRLIFGLPSLDPRV